MTAKVQQRFSAIDEVFAKLETEADVELAATMEWRILAPQVKRDLGVRDVKGWVAFRRGLHRERMAFDRSYYTWP